MESADNGVLVGPGWSTGLGVGFGLVGGVSMPPTDSRAAFDIDGAYLGVGSPALVPDRTVGVVGNFGAGARSWGSIGCEAGLSWIGPW